MAKHIRIYYFILSVTLFVFTDNNFSSTGKYYYFEGKQVIDKIYSNDYRNKVLDIDKCAINTKVIDIPIKDISISHSSNVTLSSNYLLSFNDKIINNSFINNIKSNAYQLSYGVDLNKSTEVSPNSDNNGKYYWIDLIPNSDITFPYWVKSIEQWIEGSTKDINFWLYLITNDAKQERIKLQLNSSNGWSKGYYNISNVNKFIKTSSAFKLMKLRISGYATKNTSLNTLLFTTLNAIDLVRNNQNIYNEVIYPIEDFEKGCYWRTKINKKFINLLKIQPFPNQDEKLNSNTSNISLNTENNPYSDLFIIFGDFGYDLIKNYDICLTVCGSSNNEMLSFILEDSTMQLFEIELGKVDFNDWKKMSVSIPVSKKLSYYRQNTSLMTEYLKLKGLKISPGNNNAININIDNLILTASKQLINAKVDWR